MSIIILEAKAKVNKMDKIISFLIQPSTLRGFAILGTVLAAVMKPSEYQAIAAVGGSIIGAIEVFRNEKKV